MKNENKAGISNKSQLTFLWLIHLVLLCATFPASAKDIPTLFYISNNDNTSQVHYGIRLNSDCSPVEETPIYYYWRRTDGSTRQLKRQEQKGYGISSQLVSGNNVTLAFNAFQRYGLQKSLAITTSRTSNGGCQARAFTSIGGATTQLSHARVQVRSQKLFGETVQIQVQNLTLVGSNQRSETIGCRSNCKHGLFLP